MLSAAGYREGFLWKRGRDNGQFLSRKFVLSEREGALKYFNKNDVSTWGCCVQTGDRDCGSIFEQVIPQPPFYLYSFHKHWVPVAPGQGHQVQLIALFGRVCSWSTTAVMVRHPNWPFHVFLPCCPLKPLRLCLNRQRRSLPQLWLCTMQLLWVSCLQLACGEGITTSQRSLGSETSFAWHGKQSRGRPPWFSVPASSRVEAFVCFPRAHFICCK